MRRLAALALTAAALAAAGCGSDDEPAGQARTPAGQEEAAPTATREETTRERRAAETRTREERAGTTIRLGESQFGQVLFDRAGQAIYLFDKETSERPECYDECAAEWPPVLTDGEPQAGRGVDRRLLGTTERDDGSTQVTYNGHPLYFYAHEGRDEVRCHNVPGFGGLWLALDRRGNPAPVG